MWNNGGQYGGYDTGIELTKPQTTPQAEVDDLKARLTLTFEERINYERLTDDNKEFEKKLYIESKKNGKIP